MQFIHIRLAVLLDKNILHKWPEHLYPPLLCLKSFTQKRREGIGTQQFIKNTQNEISVQVPVILWLLKKGKNKERGKVDIQQFQYGRISWIIFNFWFSFTKNQLVKAKKQPLKIV